MSHVWYFSDSVFLQKPIYAISWIIQWLLLTIHLEIFHIDYSDFTFMIVKRAIHNCPIQQDSSSLRLWSYSGQYRKALSEILPILNQSQIKTIYPKHTAFSNLKLIELRDTSVERLQSSDMRSPFEEVSKRITNLSYRLRRRSDTFFTLPPTSLRTTTWQVGYGSSNASSFASGNRRFAWVGY